HVVTEAPGFSHRARQGRPRAFLVSRQSAHETSSGHARGHRLLSWRLLLISLSGRQSTWLLIAETLWHRSRAAADSKAWRRCCPLIRSLRACVVLRRPPPNLLS